jgi:iron complex outermembrane receptor protein
VRHRQYLACCVSLAALGFCAASPALAQTAAATETDQEAASVADIVVTAQKREQSLQDVPISIIAVSREALEGAGVHDIKDLQALTPGLNVNSSSNEVTTTIRIHGIGTVGENPGIESSVGIVIDGVYRPRNGVGFGDLGAIERIEVLRGPQGTLFGKNTSGGVVSIISQRPSFTFGGDAELTAGNYGALAASASVHGPILADKLAGSLFVAQRERDGFYDVRTGAGPRTRSDDANQDFYSVRGQLLFIASDTLDARLIADYTKRADNCCSGVQTISGPTAAYVDSLSPDSGVSRPADPFARLSYTNRGTEMQIEDRGVSLEVNWQTPFLDGAQVTSITAARQWDGFTGTDLDFSSADILYRPVALNGSVFKQFSQELRLAGSTDRLQYLVGLFYADEDLDQQSPNIFGRDYESYLSLLLSGGVDPLRLSQLTGLAPGSIFPQGAGQRPIPSNCGKHRPVHQQHLFGHRPPRCDGRTAADA